MEIGAFAFGIVSWVGSDGAKGNGSTGSEFALCLLMSQKKFRP